MPYDIRREGGKWTVFNQETGAVRGHTESRKMAQRMIEAMSANTDEEGKPKDKEKDTAMKTEQSLGPVVFQCNALKSLGDGKFAGHLVVFGSPDETDASKDRDFFTKDTDFGLDLNDKSRVIYHHGLDPVMKARTLAIAPHTMDESGIWIEGQIALRDRYERKLYAAIEAGKMGLSSATAPHLVRYKKHPNGSREILAWPLGLDASITPTPAEPRTSVFAVKSLLTAESLFADDPPPIAAKGEYLGDVEKVATMAALERVHCMLCNCLYGTMGDDKLKGAALVDRVHDVLNEYTDAVIDIIEGLMGSDADDATATAKSLSQTFRDRLDTGLSLDDHSDAVLAAVKGLSARVSQLAELRSAEGRKLSTPRLTALKSLSDELSTLHAGAQKAVKAAPPSSTDVLRLKADILLMEARASGLV